MKHAFLLLVVCLLLASCGIQIQFETPVPAAVNLGQGCSLVVRAEGRSHHAWDRDAARALRRAFQHRIAEDGYYNQPGRGYGYMAQARIELLDTHVRFTGEGKDATARLCTTVEVNLNYRNLYRLHEDVYLSRDYDGCYLFYDAAEEIARRTMKKLTPHMATYCEYVDENEQNPALGQAARACAAGNWNAGRELAQQALAANPNEAEAYYVLGLVERAAQNYAQSDAMFRRAAELQKKSKYAEGIRDNAALQRDEAIFRQQVGASY